MIKAVFTAYTRSVLPDFIHNPVRQTEVNNAFSKGRGADKWYVVMMIGDVADFLLM
jgi:hypothetical protein